MAFGGNNQGNFARKPSTAPMAKVAPAAGKTTSSKDDEVFSTGMFVPDREGVAAMASVQVKETITIPAGSYINIYDNTQSRKSDTSPSYRLVVKAGKQK